MKKLKVDESKIQGKGLFTTDAFDQGEMIGLSHDNGEPTTFIGKYHNHSEEPNAVSIKLGDKRYLMAKRPLAKGEEITTNYRLQPELEQPEDFAKGGLVKMPKPSKQGLASKKFSRSLEATNRLFTENYLFDKPKSRKRKVFDPSAKYYQGGGAYYDDARDAWVYPDGTVGSNGPAYCQEGGYLLKAEYGMPMGSGMSQNYQGRKRFIRQDGGVISQEEIDDANNAMMKARLAYAHMHGNPAAQRMVVAPDQPYVYTGEEYDRDWNMPVGVPEGGTGTHYMASFGNYAVPFIQQGPNGLYFNELPTIRDKEAIRFDSEADAEYFGGHYKEITPDESYRQEEYATGGGIYMELTDSEIEEYRRGGYIVEDLE